MRARPLALFLAASAGALSAATLTVSKDGRGAFASVQAAVDKAGPFDIVEILDTAAYDEQVTLRSPLHHLTLRSANPSAAKKPVIRWSDKANVGPKTCPEALDTSKITFDRNGALRLLDVRDIRIEGIGIDGGGPTPYNNPNVWGNGTDCNGQLFPLFFGNAGLLVYRSARVSVTGCDIANAYFGLYVKDNDPRGPYAPRGPVNALPPFSRMASGNHAFEGNAIHQNTWGIFMESAWGLGSTFRDNFIFENHHATPEAALAVKSMSSEGANQPGGAFYFKDVRYSSMAVQNNTFWHNFLEFAGGWRPGGQHLIVNNIFAAPNVDWIKDPVFGNSFLALDPFFQKRMKGNAYAAHVAFPVLQTYVAKASETDPATQSVVAVEKTVSYASATVRIMNTFPSVPPETASIAAELPLASGPMPVRIPLPSAVYTGALLKETGGLSAADGNRWVETKFLSTLPSDPDFLRPAPEFQEFLRSAPGPEPLLQAFPTDMGARPASARAVRPLRIAPLAPALVEGGQMVLRFAVQDPQKASSGSDAPALSYLRLVRKLPDNANAYGGSPSLVVPEAEALPLTASIRYGYNEVKLPASGLAADSNAYGFVEMAAQAKGALSNVAQFPILPLASRFTVEALRDTQDVPLYSFNAGQTCRLRIADAKGSAATYKIHVATASGGGLEFTDPAHADSLGYLVVSLPFTAKVRFNEYPDEGTELVWVSAFADSAGTVTEYGLSRALAFDATTGVAKPRRKGPALRAGGILKGRNWMGRRVGPR